jgi:Doubled CXXCH motif (Paired_CXXCH_1)
MKARAGGMKILQWILFLTLMMALPGIAWAQGGSATPGSGISGSAHDFTGGGALPAPSTAVGLCTYCHTPHKALSTLLLWNHTLSTNTFTWDVPATTAGTKFPSFKGDSYKGATAKCLSCHDGSVAIGDIAWFQEAKPPILDSTKHNVGEFNIGLGGNMAGNHPVAMPFPFNNTKSTYNTSTTGNAIIVTEWQSDPTAISNIRLFNDDGTGSITAGPVIAKTGIECSSCHDPHNKAAVEDLFLRGKLTGNTQASGYICLQCHIK